MRGALVVALPVALLVAAAVGVEYADPDLWGRLSVGAVLWHTGALPLLEDFSFTARGRPWIDHEWLAGVVFHALLAIGGGAALSLFKYAATAAALALAASASRAHRSREARRDPPALAAFVMAVLTPVMLIGFITTVRAQLFSFVAFAFTLWVLERARAGRAASGWLLALGFAGVVWGNAHGGVVMGVLAVLLYACAAFVDGAPRRGAGLLAVAGGMLAGIVVVNPYGWVYGRFLLHAWTLDRSAVTEWRPLLEAPPGPVRTLALAAVGLGFVLSALRGLEALRARWRARARADGEGAVATGGHTPPPASLLGPALVLGLVVCMTWLSLRIQPFLGLAAGALVPPLLGSARAHGFDRAFAGRWIALPAVLAVVPLLVIGVQLGLRGTLDTRVPRSVVHGGGRLAYPVDAVRWMRAQQLEGRLLNAFSQGEFLLWTLYPRMRVAIDGRYEEVYTQEEFSAVRDFFDFAAPIQPGTDADAQQRTRREARATLQLAAKLGADWALVPATSVAGAVLAGSERWRRVWVDSDFSLFGRRALVSAHGFAAEPARPRDAPVHFTIDDFTTAADRARFAAYPRPDR